MTRIDRIRNTLVQHFKPTELEVVDDSHKHIGHPGARSGKGHFTVSMTAEQFTNLTLLKCHQLVYAALDDLMETDIHALTLHLKAPTHHSQS